MPDITNAFQGGMATQTDARPGVLPDETSLKRLDIGRLQVQEDVEVDRLVDLTFVALLRRKPDQDTLLAYREGFANGTTFHDLIDDVVGSDEYRASQQRLRQLRTASTHTREATPDPERGNDLPTLVAILTARLAEMGCQPQSSTITKDDRGDDGDGRRMHSLRVTLAVLDRL